MKQKIKSGRAAPPQNFMGLVQVQNNFDSVRPQTTGFASNGGNVRQSKSNKTLTHLDHNSASVGLIKR